MRSYPAYKAAAMHVSPVFLDTARTIDKACSLIAEAARHGAKLVAFPEAYVPAFPLWATLRAPGASNDFFRRLAANAVQVPGPEVQRIAQAARDNDVFVSIGITEGTSASVGCLWNTNLLIGQDGRLLNHHRKIAPTYYEKLIWANGDGVGLDVVDTDLGRIGALICAENANALARHAMMAQGEQVHIMCYPPGWIGRGSSVDKIIQSHAEVHCISAKVFCIVSCAFLSDADRDALADGDMKIRAMMDGIERPKSMILAPSAEPCSPLLCNEEGIAYGNIDLAECVVPKQFLDFTGNVSRFDIFKLTVDRSANDAVVFEDERRVRKSVGRNLTIAVDSKGFHQSPRLSA
jgi:aliphatic nitrilase